MQSYSETVDLVYFILCGANYIDFTNYEQFIKDVP